MAVSNNRGFQRTLSKLPHMQSLKVRIEWGTISKPLLYNSRHKLEIGHIGMRNVHPKGSMSEKFRRNGSISHG